VGTCDHVLSCQALNAAIYRGPGSGGAYPVLKAPGRGCEESGHVLSWGGGDEADWADRWQNLACPWLPR
jgi:hypothetical protein